MAGSPPNLHKMDSKSACIQGVLKVKVKGHVICTLFWILGISYSIIDGLVIHSSGNVKLCVLILSTSSHSRKMFKIKIYC